jgi:hypothetical protein
MSDPQQPEAGPAHAPLLQMAYGALTTQILCVGVELGLAECLAQAAPATANDVAPKLGVDAAIAERFLRAFACLGLFLSAHRAILLNSLSLRKKFSMRWRHL